MWDAYAIFPTMDEDELSPLKVAGLVLWVTVVVLFIYLNK